MTNQREAAHDNDDPLRPARGIVNGIIIAIALWCALWLTLAVVL